MNKKYVLKFLEKVNFYNNPSGIRTHAFHIRSLLYFFFKSLLIRYKDKKTVIIDLIVYFPIEAHHQMEVPISPKASLSDAYFYSQFLLIRINHTVLKNTSNSNLACDLSLFSSLYFRLREWSVHRTGYVCLWRGMAGKRL